MHPIFTGALALSLAAAVCGLLWLAFRPPNPEKRWHVFFMPIRMNGVWVPLYHVGDDVGTRSVPGVQIGGGVQWKCVTVKGYRDRESAHAAATTHGEKHHADAVAAQQGGKGDYTLFARNLDPDLQT